MIRRGFYLILIPLALLSGCKPKTRTGTGGTPTPSPSPSTSESAVAGVHDCNKLATASEVSTIYGVTVSNPTHSEAASGSLGIPGAKAEACHYAAQPAGDVSFSFGVGPDAGTVRSVFEQSKQAQNGATVNGIGDAAYFDADSHNFLVIKGVRFISVGHALSSDTNKEISADSALANKVLTKLEAEG
jgi:hypothetical protein